MEIYFVLFIHIVFKNVSSRDINLSQIRFVYIYTHWHRQIQPCSVEGG